MEQLFDTECEAISGGILGKVVQFVLVGIGDRLWAAADRAAASPGSQFESTPFLDAVAAGNMTA